MKIGYDRHRFNKRANELRDHTRLFEQLACVPERVTEKDLRQAADVMRGAAIDLDELIKATPTGCICHRIQDGTHDYLDYAEECLHHRQLYRLRESLKADYAKMEKALKNEPRMKFVAAALSGTAGHIPADSNRYVERALAIADEAIRRIAGTE